MKNIPAKSIVSLTEYAAIESELDEANATLAAKEEQIERLESALLLSKAGVSPASIAAALASDEDEAFESAVDEARDALGQLPSIVRRVVWQQFGHPNGGPYRPGIDEGDEIAAQVENALLVVWMDENDHEVVELCLDDDAVSEAVAAIEALLGMEVPENYAVTFRSSQKMKFSLSNRRVWDALHFL